MKAYVITDADEHACVRFAQHAVVARREGANELDIDFESATCSRARHFDEYSPGPVPWLVLIDHGWWCECHGCGIRIDSDHEGWVDDEVIELHPVEDGRGVYCTPECRDDDVAYRAEQKRRQIAALADLTDWVARRYHGALFEGHPHSYVERCSDESYRWWTERCIVVPFSFPGQKYGTCSARIDDGKSPEVHVPQGDLDAWTEWRSGKLRAEAA